MIKKKSPNKWVTWGKGILCQNCNRTDWRIWDKFSDKEIITLYCIHCGMMWMKINDNNLNKVKARIREARKNGTNKRRH